MKNISYLLALHSIDGLGPIRLKAIVEYFKDPKLAWEANGSEIRQLGIPQAAVDLLIETRKKLDPIEYAKSITDSGINWFTIYDDDYPKPLKDIYDPPVILYYRGELLSEDENAIAVVGTRKITGYGSTVTRQFTSGLARAGLTIVSGLAKGVDTIAHQVALDEGGRTIAILGGGLNRLFPPENLDLAKKIADGYGAVMSEFPPDYPALAGNFPARNRIISGLSKAVLVTEAASDSGSLITAGCASEQGREVFAVPGPITSYLSNGPIDLIKMGARAVTSADEILEELGVNRVQNAEFRVKSETNLSHDEKKVLDILENESLHIDEICRKLGLPASSISGYLLKMEIAGIVTSLGSGNYCKSAR